VLEVHAVDARDQGGDGDDRGDRRDPLDHLVLVDADKGEVGLEHAREELALGGDLLVDAAGVVRDIPKEAASSSGTRS
jgi:hypothetical protein